MKITFQDNFSFKIEGDKQSLLINPQDESQVDKKLALTIFSEFKKGNTFANQPAIDWPGEFEYSGISVNSYKLRENLAQYFEFEGVRFAFLGDLNKIVSQEKLEPFVNADVLFLPKTAEGMNNKDLKKLVEEIDPRVIILMGEGALFGELLKELGAENTAPKELFEISKKSLPQDHSVFVNFVV